MDQDTRETVYRRQNKGRPLTVRQLRQIRHSTFRASAKANRAYTRLLANVAREAPRYGK